MTTNASASATPNIASATPHDIVIASATPHDIVSSPHGIPNRGAMR